MTINPDRWTLKTQEAFTSAVERARSAHNAEVTPDHLLAAILDQPDGIAGPVLTRVGVEPAVVRDRIAGDLGRLPQAFGGEEPGINRALRDVLTAADTQRSDMGDEYLSVEHLVLAMADRIGVDRDQLLTALRDVRGEPPGHLAEPRGDLPGPRALRPGPDRGGEPGEDRPGHRARRGDPSGHPGALPAHQEQPGAHR